MSKHTPGPWKITDVELLDNIAIDSNELKSRRICKVSRFYTNHEANARLIAASPKMYKALKEIESITACDNPCGKFDPKQVDVWHLAKEAIKGIEVDNGS